MNLGDIAVGQILYFHFTTRQFSTGAPITSANLAISVYKDDSTTQSTAGVTVTFTSGFDNVAGLVSVKIDTSQDGTFYAAAHDFSVVVTTGTADSVSIVGEVVGYFSIQNRSALRPTTAGRTINIDSTGLSDSNMVKVGPTGTGTAQTARDIGASVLVGDKTGFSLTSGYDPAKTAAQAGDAMALTSGERNSTADAILARGVTGGANARTVAQALAFLRNKWTLVGTTLTVYDTDDTSILWTATLTTDATAQPVTASDPA